MDVEITRLDGTSFRLSEYDVIVRDFIVGSVPVTGIYGTIEGRAGTVDYGADLGQRQITVPFYTEAHDLADYPVLRDKLSALIVSREPFYIRELRRERFGKGDSHFVGGKRYKVRLSGEFTPDQMGRYGFSEFVFETTGLPYAESIGTTQDIQRDGVVKNYELWYNMGLIPDNDSFIYTHNSKNFRVYNAGNVPIHPFEQDFKMTIRNVQGSTSYFELRNITNGLTFRVNEGVTSSQTIVMDGPTITRNSLQFLSRTNMQYIEILPGWNMFEVRGATSAEVEFNFRYYYL